jgi:glycerol kinase
VIAGLSRGVRGEHLVRAALEAIAYQTRDVLDAMGVDFEVLRADGGGSANRFLMQFQADIASVPVEVPAERETTALGAAALAGLGVGTWQSVDELAGAWRLAARYEPQMPAEEAERLLSEWRQAVSRTLLQA